MARPQTVLPIANSPEIAASLLGRHWKQFRLRHVAQLRVSNVDKHVSEGEISVRLCNYVDVYKHDRISDRIPFMRATAKPEEIERFCLWVDDVIITKDSEAWNDIGVPTLVRYAAPDLVCGYHLALLRPKNEFLSGAFLFRAIQSQAAAYQFHVAATGVTRYGLSHESIKSVTIPVPKLDEQHAIVRFLDHADRRIRRYIRTKRKLIGLLNEQRQAVIQGIVLRGLNSNVRLKPSAVESLGDVPEHWEVRRLKEYFKEFDDRSTTGTEVLLSLRMHRGLVPHTEVSRTPTSEAALIGFKRVIPGQIVMNRMRASIGLFGIVSVPGLVSPDYAVLQPTQPMEMRFFLELFKSQALATNFRTESKGLGTGSSGFMRLYTDRFGTIKVPIPPLEEQSRIVQAIGNHTGAMDRAIATATRQIELMREYRIRLIEDVVTGRLDVRAVSASLPDEPEEVEKLDETKLPVEADIEDEESEPDPQYSEASS